MTSSIKLTHLNTADVTASEVGALRGRGHDYRRCAVCSVEFQRMPDPENTIDFLPDRYIEIGSDLRAGPTIDRPEEWTKSLRVTEEPTETLLTVNLPALVGFPLVWVRWAWAMHRSVDIVATDPLGRVHLFELKKGSVGAQESSQLEQYMLGHVFGSPDRFLTEGTEAHRYQIADDYLTRRIAGVFANERMAIFGWRPIRSTLGDEHPDSLTAEGRPLSARSWRRLGTGEQTRRIHAALWVRAKQRGIDGFPPLDDARALARSIGGELGSALERHRPLARPARPLVLWLVGRSIQPAALERIRVWRRMGVDARAMGLEIQRHGRSFVARVRSEDAQARDALEARVLATLRKGEVADLDMFLYEEVSASSARHRGGRPRNDPRATLTFPGGETVDLGSD